MLPKLLAKHLFFMEQVIDMPLAFDVYLFSGHSFLPKFNKGDLFTMSSFNQLKSENITYLFIPKEELREFNFSVEKKLTTLLQDQSIPIEKRATMLHSSSVALVEEFFDNTDTLQDYKRVTTLVDNMVGLLTQNKNMLGKMLALSSNDFYTYRHSVDTALYTVLFAKFIGINNTQQLNLFGQAGLLHDLGKREISTDIINKKGPLSDEEWNIMKAHPLKGFELLKDQKEIHQDVKDAALYHHEKLDGSGYPYGLSGDQIPFFGRLVSIADIFSALTTHRSYSKARSYFDALDFMVEKLQGKVDRQLLKTFIKMFEK